MKPISNKSLEASHIAYAYVNSVLPGSAITWSRGEGRAYLYAFLGSGGPGVSGSWEHGEYVAGRVGRRSFSTAQGFLNAVMRATARP